MSNIWERIAKSAREKANGRIYSFPGLWRLRGSNYGKIDECGILFDDRKDDLGRPMEMVGGGGTKCDLDKWKGTCAKTGGHYWIPLKLCRKCEHYRKRRKGAWYPCCGKIASNNVNQAVTKELEDTLSNAVDFANSIIGKPSKKGSE